MYSVTKRISMVKQPYGGYLNKKQFDITTIDDGKTLNEAENIHASLIGLAVDYLTRFMMGTSVEEAFKISLQGALCLDLFLNNASGKKGLALGNAKKLLKGIKGLDNESVSNACKLVGYDVCFRAGVIGYKPVGREALYNQTESAPALPDVRFQIQPTSGLRIQMYQSPPSSSLSSLPAAHLQTFCSYKSPF